MIGCLGTRVRKQPIIVLYFEFETDHNPENKLSCDVAQLRNYFKINWDEQFLEP